jgi:hypothetical protein
VVTLEDNGSQSGNTPFDSLRLQSHVSQSLAMTAGLFRSAIMSRQRQKEFLEDQERAEPGKVAA